MLSFATVGCLLWAQLSLVGVAPLGCLLRSGADVGCNGSGVHLAQLKELRGPAKKLPLALWSTITEVFPPENGPVEYIRRTLVENQLTYGHFTKSPWFVVQDHESFTRVLISDPRIIVISYALRGEPSRSGQSHDSANDDCRAQSFDMVLVDRPPKDALNLILTKVACQDRLIMANVVEAIGLPAGQVGNPAGVRFVRVTELARRKNRERSFKVEMLLRSGDELIYMKGVVSEVRLNDARPFVHGAVTWTGATEPRTRKESHW